MRELIQVVVVALVFGAFLPGCANAASDLQSAAAAFEAAKTTVTDVKNAVEAEKAALARQYICEDIRVKDWQREFGAVASEWNAVCSKKATPAVPVAQ